jgi:hypothetical protein
MTAATPLVHEQQVCPKLDRKGLSLASIQIRPKLLYATLVCRSHDCQPWHRRKIDRGRQIARRVRQFPEYGIGNDHLVVKQLQQFETTDPRQIQDGDVSETTIKDVPSGAAAADPHGTLLPVMDGNPRFRQKRLKGELAHLSETTRLCQDQTLLLE